MLKGAGFQGPKGSSSVGPMIKDQLCLDGPKVADAFNEFFLFYNCR